MQKRTLIAGMVHETHTFVTGLTRLGDFHIQTAEAILGSAGDTSSMGGMMEVAKECDWEVLPVANYYATPSALVSDEAVEQFWKEFLEAANRELPNGVDGVLLNLHGAMASESYPDVEGELLRRIRSVGGLEKTPVCASLDLHGNITPLMARHANGFVGYRENPHTDIKQTAIRAAQLLDRLMRTGEVARVAYAHPPIVWPPTGTGTADEPMRSLEAMARAIESAHPEILAVSVFGGFSFADIPETGVSFTAVTVGSLELAQERLRTLSDYAFEHRERGSRMGLKIEEAMKLVLAHSEGPVLLVEPSDNIGGGSPGDLTTVLRALVEADIQNGAVCLNDPEIVRHLWNSSPGELHVVTLGGKSGQIGSEPIVLPVEFISRSDGEYDLEDRNSHAAGSGLRQSMGDCVVVRYRSEASESSNAPGIRILLTSQKTPPYDLGQFRSQGIVPESLFVIGVKAAVAHRQAYHPIAKASYVLDTPGPCSENLSHLPYRLITRPIYPLD